MYFNNYALNNGIVNVPAFKHPIYFFLKKMGMYITFILTPKSHSPRSEVSSVAVVIVTVKQYVLVNFHFVYNIIVPSFPLCKCSKGYYEALLEVLQIDLR